MAGQNRIYDATSMLNRAQIRPAQMFAFSGLANISRPRGVRPAGFTALCDRGGPWPFLHPALCCTGRLARTSFPTRSGRRSISRLVRSCACGACAS